MKVHTYGIDVFSQIVGALYCTFFIARRNTKLTHGIQTVGQQQLLLDPLYAEGKLHHQLGLKGFATRYRFQDISGLTFIICGGDKFPANLSLHRPFTLPVYNHKSND